MIRILILFLLIFSLHAHAQNGTIKGTVNTSDGQPAEFVNIVLEKTAKGTVVNEAGHYQINKVPAGTYTLTASFTGLLTQKSTVTVAAGDTSSVNFTLAEDNLQLQEVVVSGNVKLVNKETEYVARMPLKNLENPQVYHVVGKDLMKEQMMTDVKDVFRAAAGVAPTEYVTGSFAVVFRGFTNFDYARNGLATSVYRSGTEIANLERVELIKGPSGTLFGAQVATFGGAMNLVTKKPYAGFGGEVGYGMGSFDLSRATVDINTPLSKEKTVLLRFNAVDHQQNSSNEYGKNKRFMISPSLSFQASDRLSFLFDFEFFKSNATRLAYTLLFADEVPFKSTKDIPLGFKKSFFQNDLLSDAQATKYFGQAKYQISANWTSTTGISHVNEFLNHSYQPYVNWISADTAVTSIRHFGPRERTYANVQQNFNGSFNTGRFHHNLLIGASYEYNDESLTYSVVALDKINVNEPFERSGLSRVNSILADPSTTASHDAYGGNAFGIYVSDVINWTDRLSTMLSLRFDRFEQTYEAGFVQPSLSPKLGIVYQVVKDQVSLFGNFMNGFLNQGPIEQPNGSLFKPNPVFANQLEGGIKAELPGNKLGGSISYYHIGIDNALRTDDAQYSFQDGKQVSKGVELELTANPVSGLNIVAGYGFNENKFTKADLYEGKFQTQAPQHIVNYWLSYRLPFQNLKGIGLGFGGNYVSDSYFNSSNTYVIPSYQTINATVFYQKEKWKLGFKLNNITNVKYWDSVGNAQFTRNFVTSFSFKF
ncbi:TonB-dependent receptor [Dyadobacter sp. CY261]|uniref:TonB-dependent receptor n=1 Tax=Dyadobacter sp. CY261 TaxID=2907203 RepID=UPI001F1A986D|nr:TonB-dependent receptor [Dyadobacter sp. CY261]MCF0075493.1 TonB-dependent receptor [Dyadobacter sp. CY261]